MDDHHQPRLVAQALLHDRLDRHVLERQHLRDLRQHARLVGDLEVQVEGARRRPGRSRSALGRRRRRGRRDHRADHVAEDRAGGLRAARPGSRHRDLGDLLRLDRDRIERPVDRRQRMARVQERRMHADRQPAADPLGGADQLQPEPEVARVLEVVGLDVLDPLVADLVDVDRGLERQPGDDRHLRGGVAAVDVLGRVGLGVPEPLRLGQRLLERDPGARHLGEDEVRGAVDDPVDAVDRRPGERLLQHADHRARRRRPRPRSAAARPLSRARVPQLLAVLGEQLLVGGDHVLARRASPAAGSRGPARCRRSARRSGPSSRGSRRTSPRTARQDARQLRPQAGDPLDPVGVLRAAASANAAADRPVPEQPDPERAQSTLDVPAHQVRRRSRGARRPAPSRRGRRSPAAAGTPL